MRNALILHGHFYQPARENPWTGLVPRQPSADPYENWNTRITRECYAANASSRVLDPQGKILDIVNNYAHISFNFGPTLLSWLESNAPSVYGRILEADRASRARRGGHGNAIAQAYSHQILPLAAAEDLRTQVCWGLKDFEARFGRRSEGVWLPETAVSPAVLDVLIEEGVRFIILSPWQAEAYCPLGSQKWKPLGSEPIPSHRAYRIDRPAGSIAVFFYQQQLAHGISFEHYLRDADALYHRLLQHRQPSSPGHLINVATDGEVYGHHEPFGDMCLAALIRKVQARDELELTNYGEYLDRHPPAHLVQLKGGEANRGTSWSCVHGVSRWYRDCGCSTGGAPGWNQRWRAPLREALDNLRLELRGIYTTRLAQLTDLDPFAVRNRYVDVLTRTTSPQAFLQAVCGRPVSPEQARELLTLLEGQRYAQLMFVSCAWFFSDLSGIETIQSLAYALRAIDLYAPFARNGLLEDFLEDLEMAHSNLVEQGCGRNVLENQVLPMRQGPAYGAAMFIIAEVFRQERPLREPAEEPGRQEDKPALGIFRLERISLREDGAAFPECSGEIGVSIWPGLGKWEASFQLRRNAGIGLTLRLHPSGEERGFDFDLSLLPAQARQGILEYLSWNLLPDGCGLQGDCLARSLELGAFSRLLRAPLPAQAARLAKTSLELAVEKAAAPLYRRPGEGGEGSTGELDRLQSLLQAARREGLSLDTGAVARALTHTLSRLAERLAAAPGGVPLEEPAVQALLSILDLQEEFGLQIDLTRAQSAVFELLERQNAPPAEDRCDERGLKLLIRLASRLGINTERFRQSLFAL